MAEIKSTLDLVMEKTKNLNLSNAEKQDQKNKEMESRLRGLVQKYQDEIISLEKFRAGYQALHKEFNLTETQNDQLIRVLCGRIELGKDNEELLGLLSQFADSDIEGITSVLQEFDTAIQTAAAAQAQIAKDKLASEHFISGSAVLPNLESDPAWRQMAEEIQVQYSRLLEEEKAKISEGR
ncbi:MAG: hypothetical protein PVJ41_13705 [Desulfobacterales bacterium]|jgi:hypothetical protein